MELEPPPRDDVISFIRMALRCSPMLTRKQREQGALEIIAKDIAEHFELCGYQVYGRRSQHPAMIRH
ncbi:MAG: hypothetical protein HYR63_07230 [Proteobacteria bacterium]|nr:hypothetical protein [Pseudomonadota bacterium]MBI3496087.1 hypothetical protein [Pseudomonadota bacterium]